MNWEDRTAQEFDTKRCFGRISIGRDNIMMQHLLTTGFAGPFGRLDFFSPEVTSTVETSSLFHNFAKTRLTQSLGTDVCPKKGITPKAHFVCHEHPKSSVVRVT